MAIPSIRLSNANQHPIRDDGEFVLYWMIAFRRPRFNFALEHAVDRAKELGKPLLILEPLSARYPWASDRMHRFVIEGMQDNERAFSAKSATYIPYVEPKRNASIGLIEQLAKQACVVVTDEFPCFFLPKMIAAVKESLPARLELVDSNCVMPMRHAERTFTVAHSYRRWMQKNILDFLLEGPKADPLSRVKLPRLSQEVVTKFTSRWPKADLPKLLKSGGLKSLPIDHDVAPSEVVTGGHAQASRRLTQFLKSRLDDYGDSRNHPDEHATTGLSPHLHFGHIAIHEVVEELLDREQWTPDQASAANGKNHGFWNTSPSAEAFLDQVLTWREMGFNLCFREPETYDKYESLPDWAQATLSEHSSDPRPEIYSLEKLERAETGDDIWNAAQREIVQTGVMHNYLRMLWGKKILQWSKTPREALAAMIELNNKYGLDGRDPNSYSGIFWVLGRYDRAWGPKRPIFGSVRYMTSDSTRKKLRLKGYLKRFGPQTSD